MWRTSRTSRRSPSTGLVGIDDFVCVFGEVGVGGGVVLGGRLFRGTHGFGGEFGHVSVDADGRRCACGSRGCVETLVGQESTPRAAGISTASGRTRSLNDELVRRATDGSQDVLASAGTTRAAGSASRSRRRSTSSISQAVVLGGCFWTAFTLARRRGSADARGAGRSRPGRGRSSCFRRRSATAQRCGARRRSRCGACWRRRGRWEAARARKRRELDGVRVRRVPDARRRWRSGIR